MVQTWREKLVPADLSWTIINNLKEFNQKPDAIKEILDKLRAIPEHQILCIFTNIYDKAYEFYKVHAKFPDVQTLIKLCPNQPFKEDYVGKFTMDIYEHFISHIDQETGRLYAIKELTENPNYTIDDMRKVGTRLLKISESQVEIPKDTKESLLNLYKNYSKSYNGVKTYIREVDEVIGILGFKSLSAFGAPSGHGKSTFAITTAYNAAVFGGHVVDYLSFEVPSEHIWFNLVSMESHYLGIDLQSMYIKESALTEQQEADYLTCMESLMKKLNKSGGFINIIDQTKTQANTFDGLCARLESIAEERGRGASLIIVDNVDNLKILKSSEKDDTTKVNNFIIQLDSYCKNYYHETGTHIMLLTQVNRPAMRKLDSAKQSEDKKVTIDVTCIQQYNALYEKPVCVMIGYSDETMRSIDKMNIYPVKLRNRPLPTRPIQLDIKFEFSLVGSVAPFTPSLEDLSKSPEEINTFSRPTDGESLFG